VTESLAPERPVSSPAPRPRPARTYWPWLLLAGWAAQVGVRLLFARAQTAPIIYSDEAGYLIAARWLTGGAGADLSGVTFYQGGYSLLLTPAYLFGNDPEVVYRLALGINALVGATVFPLGFLLLRRRGVARMPAYPLAWAAALLPATSLYGVTALADAVLPAVVLGWLLALESFVRRGNTAAAVMATLAACYAYATHSRGAVVLLVHVAVLCLYALGPRVLGARARRPALVALGVAAAGYAAGAVLNARLSHALYPAGPRDLGANLADRLTSLDGQAWALSGAVGQLWAMMAGTWGLGALGLVAVASALFRRRTPVDERVMAGVLLAVTAGIAYASSAALPDEHRVGNFAYGRYLSCVAMVYALIGLAVIVRGRAVARRAAAGVAVFGLAGLWVRLYAGDRLRTHLYLSWDFPEVGLLGGSYDELRIAITSLVATGLLVVLMLLGRWRSPALFAALLVVNLIAMTLIVAILAQPVRLGPPVPGAPDGAVAVAARLPEPEPRPELIRSRLAFRVWWTRLQRFDPEQGAPPGVCTAIVPWPAGILAQDTWPEHPPGWRFQRGGVGGLWWVAWHDPSCRAEPS
jgi:hypothetical protein